MNDLRNLQDDIFATNLNKALTERAKIVALLQVVWKLGAEYTTRVKILKDKILTLDYESVVVSLKETEQRLKSKATYATDATDEQALTANDRSNKRPKRSGKGPGQNQNSQSQSSQNQGGQNGQKRKRDRSCWCCGDDGHMKRECSIWLQTLDGKEYAKRQKTSSTGPLPTPGSS